MNRDAELPAAIKGLERVRNTLQLSMVRQGYDFETHGGKSVRYKGPAPDWAKDLHPPIGWSGEVVYTKKNMWGMVECVMVAWEFWRIDRSPDLFHKWSELEVAE